MNNKEQGYDAALISELGIKRSGIESWLAVTGNEAFKKIYFGSDKLMVDALRLIHHFYR